MHCIDHTGMGCAASARSYTSGTATTTNTCNVTCKPIFHMPYHHRPTARLSTIYHPAGSTVSARTCWREATQVERKTLVRAYTSYRPSNVLIGLQNPFHSPLFTLPLTIYRFQDTGWRRWNVLHALGHAPPISIVIIEIYVTGLPDTASWCRATSILCEFYPACTQL